MINKPPPHNMGYNRDPDIKALKRRGFINHGSTLGFEWLNREYQQYRDNGNENGNYYLGLRGLGFRAQGLGFRASGSELRVSSRLEVQALRFEVQSLGLKRLPRASYVVPVQVRIV